MKITVNNKTSFEDAKEIADQLDKAFLEASRKFKTDYAKYRGKTGIYSDEIKSDPKFVSDKKQLENLRVQLVKFNGWYTKRFSKELKQARRNKRTKSFNEFMEFDKSELEA